MITVSGTWDVMKKDLHDSLDSLLKKNTEEKEVIEIMIYMINSPRTKIIIDKGEDNNGC